MAEAALSATETALENQPVGALQVRVAVLCTLIQICSGYDNSSIGWVMAYLGRTWHLPYSTMAATFLWSSIGTAAGVLIGGEFGDRIGRKPALLVSVAMFGVASLTSALAQSEEVLMALRFITGLGIGGAAPSAVALAADYAPARHRATVIMATLAGAPAGVLLGGQFLAVLLQHFGWPGIFVVGGAAPLLVVAATAVWLPESPRFLVARSNLSTRRAELLQQLSIMPSAVVKQYIDISGGSSWKMFS